MRTWSNPFYMQSFNGFWKYIDEEQFVTNCGVSYSQTFIFPNVTQWSVSWVNRWGGTGSSWVR